jgi:hypothetical protein
MVEESLEEVNSLRAGMLGGSENQTPKCDFLPRGNFKQGLEII